MSRSPDASDHSSEYVFGAFATRFVREMKALPFDHSLRLKCRALPG